MATCVSEESDSSHFHLGVDWLLVICFSFMTLGDYSSLLGLEVVGEEEVVHGDK